MKLFKNAEGFGEQSGQHICFANASHKWLSASLCGVGSSNGIRRSVYECGSSGQTRAGNGNHFRHAFHRRSNYTGRTPEHIHTDDGNRPGNSYPHGQTVILSHSYLTTQKPVCRLSLSKNEILHFCKDAEGLGKRRGQHICSANASHKWLSASLAVWGQHI